MQFIGPLVVAFMAFLAIMNPLANLPVFLGLTAEDTPAQRRRIALRSLLITFGLIAVFAIGGKWIFEAFGITMPALRITGGVLVFLIGFHMVQGRASTVTHPQGNAVDAVPSAGTASADTASTGSPAPGVGAAKTSAAGSGTASGADSALVQQRLDVAVSPLAMPILAGPGTIATAMNVSAQKGWGGVAATLVAFAVLCLITYVVFRYGAAVTRFLGHAAMTIMTRVMGLILAVIGVQMLIAGITSAFPILARAG